MIRIQSASFVRPGDTTPYTSGDLVANNVTAGSVVPLTIGASSKAAGTGRIKRVRLNKTGTSVTNAAFRVHFFRSSPVVANGDNGAISADGNAKGYIGSVDVTVDKVFSDGAAGTGVATTGAGTEIPFILAAGQKRLFALIEARGAYTPASGETFTVTAEIEEA